MNDEQNDKLNKQGNTEQNDSKHPSHYYYHNDPRNHPDYYKGHGNWVRPFHPVTRNKRGHYQPWYDDHADYNTNALSYYDYLARFNGWIGVASDFINRLMDRDIEVEDTPAIDMTKIGDWIYNGDCPPDKPYDDVVTVKADLITSKQEKNYEHRTLEGEITVPNGSEVLPDGLWSPDYKNVLDAILDMIQDILDRLDKIEDRLDKIEGRLDDLEQAIDDLKQQIADLEDKINNKLDELEKQLQDKIDEILDELNNKIDNLDIPDTTHLNSALQKIVDNLHNSGALDSNDLSSFNFNRGRDIATGNINLFGGSPDGNSFIRTTSGSEENDVTAGVN